MRGAHFHSNSQYSQRIYPYSPTSHAQNRKRYSTKDESLKDSLEVRTIICGEPAVVEKNPDSHLEVECREYGLA